MPAGVGYGPLPPPPGLLADQPVGIPRPVLPGMEQQISPPSLGAVEMLQPPQIPVEAAPEQLPPPPVVAEQQPAPVPTWLQEALAARQPSADATAPEAAAGAEEPAVSGAPESEVEEPDELVLPEGIAPDSPTGLMLRGAWVQQQAQKAKVEQLELAGSALQEAEQRTATRLEDQQARQEQARERVTAQNAEIQQALRTGPGGTWRDVVFAGASALGAVLGAAFDRSGTLQKQLPQTLNAIVGQWQERTQNAFGRELQALQVRREGAQDELDEALDESRQIEQAGAAARVAILEEAQRQIQLAGEQGQLDLMELQRLGIPQQMEAEIEAAKAKQAQIFAEQARKETEFKLKEREAEADIAYKQEQARSERADRAKQWVDLDLARQRLALDKDRSQALKQQDALDVQKKKLDILKEQGAISDRELGKAVPLPGGQVLVANDAERARAFSSQVASAEILGGLLDRIAVKLETGTDQYWASPEAQRLLSDYNAAVLATKDAEVLGAIQGADMGLIEGGLGPDPSKISLSNLRSQAPRIRQTRDNLGRKINAKARAISSKWAAEGGTIELPRFEAPADALPTAEEARGQLLPIRSADTGVRPRLSPADFDAAVKTVRETAAKEVAGVDRDAVVRAQADQLAGALEEAREERERVERERDEATKRRKVLSKLGGPKADKWARTEAALTTEIRTVEQYEKRLADALKRERRLLWQRTGSGDPRIRSSAADRAAYKRVANLIGDLGAKPKAKD